MLDLTLSLWATRKLIIGNILTKWLSTSDSQIIASNDGFIITARE